MQSTTFFDSLSLNDLALEATPLFLWETGAVDNAEDVAKFLWRGGPMSPQGSSRPPREVLGLIVDERPEKKYWAMVKDELTAFLCTDDKRYKELWKKVNELQKGSTHMFVALIAAYLGEKFGLTATVLSSFVAVVLYGALKIGTEAYCKLKQS